MPIYSEALNSLCICPAFQGIVLVVGWELREEGEEGAFTAVCSGLSGSNT